jgi:two-component system nitrate/nitrite sensor histidine kinase NarX
MQIFSNQISLANMNRELRSRARAAAAQEERSRLARDLHDSVTQTLFSASMIAGVLPELWAQDEAAGRHRLEQVQQLTRGALAEMRALLLELRPEGLIEAELGVLLRQLSEALSGRRRIEIELSAHSSCPMPADVKVACYRIAQEALNNIEKHAQATIVQIQLTCADGGVSLRISDDGRGFDPEAVTPDRMGLRIMRERADAVGAHLEIETEQGVGTELILNWDRSWQEEE